MKDIIKVFDVINIVRRLKNNEIKPKFWVLYLMYIVGAFCVVAYLLKEFETKTPITAVEYVFVYMLFLLIVIMLFHFQAFLMYIFTPKELTYKKSCIIEISRAIACVVCFILLTPIRMLFSIPEQVISAVLSVVSIYLIFQIKALYCPPNFKRIYALLAIEIWGIIYMFIK